MAEETTEAITRVLAITRPLSSCDSSLNRLYATRQPALRIAANTKPANRLLFFISILVSRRNDFQCATYSLDVASIAYSSILTSIDLVPRIVRCASTIGDVPPLLPPYAQ